MKDSSSPVIRAGLALCGLGALAGGYLAAGSRSAESPSSKPLPPALFQNWPHRVPDVALVLTGEQHSYLKFCGCSQPQLGGLERRYNFIAKLKEKGWPVVAFDLGDLVYPRSGTPADQTLLKYTTAMSGLDLLGFSAVGVGQHEFNLPLMEGLSRYTLQKPDANPRILAANIKDRMGNFPLDDKRAMIGDAATVPLAGGVRVGVVAVVGPSVRNQINDKSLQFEDNKDVLPKALAGFDAAGAKLRVLLYQGLPEEAQAVAKAFPGFNVVLSKSREEEPPAQPVVVGNTIIVSVGHKGRYVGVVGVFFGANPAVPELHYQLVPLAEDYETDEDKVKNHPAIDKLEEYARQVKDLDLSLRFPKTEHPTQVAHKGQRVAFVGSDKCAACHPADYQKWKQTKHSHAFEALTDHAVKPSLRQFDGECIVCHTVGYPFVNGYISEKRTPHLKHVGCENCHGPGELHVSQPTNPIYRKDMSPWKSAPTDYLTAPGGGYNDPVLKAVDAVCQKCHDTDNDPKYRFEKNWPHVKHGKTPAVAGGR